LSDVCIVGLGPWGLCVLERFVDAARRHPTTALHIHVIEPARPGSGIFSLEQPDYLVLNTPCGQHSMYPFPEMLDADRLGKGFYEWATDMGYRWQGTACRVSDQGEAVGPHDFLPRRLMGEYLEWFYQVLCAEVPGNASITHYQTSAVDIEPLPNERERVHLQDGREIVVDHVVLTTGHIQGDAGSARDPAVTDPYPVEGYLGSVRPDEVVAIEGMGLVALDVITALTVGLGGSYTTGLGGSLRYHPSGREPSLYLFSRGGYPYCAKSFGAADPAGDYRPAICTVERVSSLKQGADGTKRQIDARSELLPLVFAEMELRYYTIAARAAHGSTVAGQVHRELVDAWTDGRFDEVRSLYATTYGSFRASELFFQGDRSYYIDSDAYEAEIYAFVKQDVAAALVPGGTSPLKAALETLRALRDTIRLAVEFKGLTFGSHLDFQAHLSGRFARLVAGPPAFRSQQMLALIDAGVLKLPFGPSPDVLPAPGRGFTVRSTRLEKPFELRADRLVRAHVDLPSIDRSASPLLTNLMRRRRVRPVSFGHAQAGSIDLTEDFHPLGSAGKAQGRLWVFGVITEGVRYFTLYVPSPNSRARAFVDAEICAGEVLREAGRQLKQSQLPAQPRVRPASTVRQLRVALVNNMADGAFEETQRRFIELLGQQGGAGCRAEVDLFALPGVPRSPEVQALIAECYGDLDQLRATPPDAIVVTGAEPKKADLTEELYWPALEDLLVWARSAVPSMLVSCLSAHGALWTFDGLPRRLLLQKCSGVFAHTVDTEHPLMAGIEHLSLPHSRFNEVTVSDLDRAGYRALAHSGDAGWAIAVGERGGCQLLLLQGHPEYAPHTLLREYRRDVRRYLSGDQGSYPHVPTGYLAPEGVEAIEQFERHVRARPRDPALMEDFPYDLAALHIDARWESAAQLFIGNWLESVRKRLGLSSTRGLAPVRAYECEPALQ